MSINRTKIAVECPKCHGEIILVDLENLVDEGIRPIKPNIKNLLPKEIEIICELCEETVKFQLKKSFGNLKHAYISVEEE